MKQTFYFLLYFLLCFKKIHCGNTCSATSYDCHPVSDACCMYKSREYKCEKQRDCNDCLTETDCSLCKSLKFLLSIMILFII